MDYNAPTHAEPTHPEKNRTIVILIICMIAVDIIVGLVFYDMFTKKEQAAKQQTQEQQTSNEVEQ